MNREQARAHWWPKLSILEEQISEYTKEIKLLEKKLNAAQVERNRIKEAIALGRQSLVHRQKWAPPGARWVP